MARFWVFPIAVAGALFAQCAVNARAQDATSCTSSVTVLFNRYGNTPVPSGSTIWFSSVLEGVATDAGDLAKKQVRIDVRESRITFGRWPYVVRLPDSTIVLDSSTGDPQRWWMGNSWSVTYAPSQIPEAFFDGAPFAVPEPFVPGSSGPVTWTATFTASRRGVNVRWAWSAAAYSQFGANGRLLVKQLTAPVEAFRNADPAGTPELFKQFVLPGAMGSGAPQYTGARSDAATVAACVSATPPPPTTSDSNVRPRRPVVLQWRGVSSPAPPSFAAPVSQTLALADGSVAQAVDRCYALDLCATVSYGKSDRLAIYSEGAARCKPPAVYIDRTSAERTVFAFERVLDYDASPTEGRRCARMRTTRMVTAGGHLQLTISENADGTLRFHFTSR